ncbi:MULTISPECIES: heme biosynthesis HemY N-terminal domain-containing protein [Pseudidiomarina]|uniref:HemY protein n=2 Tax=Pseudidiomarina TaxID=2800384 RepID=A0A368URY0_9GAMM|nr:MULTISPECIES: heme biosynthesis HemY N-terminal domain-containing protein [Pseudidiomarina]PWW10483.1 HemY protein [Pseudidiomarina maritima]RBP88123.1 HemY protein [Pseudidiomarina tainanensis]RCW30134.1 HemY protein [Pseudidiomarina tainanensis]
MRFALTLIILLIAGLLIGPLWSGNTGYILISLGQWTIETSIVAAIIILTLLILVLRLLLTGIRRVIRGTSWGMSWFGRRREAKAGDAYTDALEALLQGDYVLASRNINRCYQLGKDQQDALLAAYIAAQLGDLKQAQDWLNKTGRTDDFRLAEMLFSLRADPANASSRITELAGLLKQYPHHPQLVKLAILSYRNLHKYREISDLLPTAAQLNLFSATELAELTEQTYLALMLAAAKLSLPSLRQYWQSLSKEQRATTAIRTAYLQTLIKLEQSTAADKIAARGLKRGQLELADLLQRQLLVAGTELREWLQQQLKQHPDDALLLQALGQMAYLSKDYSLAQRALRKATELAPSQRVWFDLAQTYDALGDTNAALRAYREGLQHSS